MPIMDTMFLGLVFSMLLSKMPFTLADLDWGQARHVSRRVWEDAEHGHHVLGSGVQHAVEQDAIDCGWPGLRSSMSCFEPCRRRPFIPVSKGPIHRFSLTHEKLQIFSKIWTNQKSAEHRPLRFTRGELMKRVYWQNASFLLLLQVWPSFFFPRRKCENTFFLVDSRY